MRRVMTILSCIFLLHFNVASALAEGEPMTEEAQKAIWSAAMKAVKAGPQDITLGDQATLHLDAQHVYVPKAEGAEIMRMWGNSVGPGFYGLVFPKDENQPWTITIDHTAEGYVKDDDARTWNADDLLQSLKDGTAIQNEERAKMGIPALNIIGWAQPPSYDGSKHQLVWSMKARSAGKAETEPATINFNTYALGREGYFEVDLLTTEETFATDKAEALKVVRAVDYNIGKRYSDYVEGTDLVAEYGLAALVGGAAAKKLGLFAVIGVFMAKFAKVFLAIGAVGLGGIYSWFKRRKNRAG
jgi:uncharacterized membrane-anchored protein